MLMVFVHIHFCSDVTAQTENLMGYYKYPYSCNYAIVGACKYVVMWFRTPAQDEVRFVIAAKDVESTELGFSNTMDIVRIENTFSRPNTA